MRQSISSDVSEIQFLRHRELPVETELYDLATNTADRNASFNPGGFFEYPPVRDSPLLRIKAKPRMSIYLDTDSAAAVLVDAEVSYQLGESISEASITTPPQQLQVTVSNEGVTLGSAAVDVGSTGNEIPLSLDSLSPRVDAYNLTVQAVLANTTVYSTTTNLSYLPYPGSYGSVARLDQLYGGTYAQRGSNSSWAAIYPYARPLACSLVIEPTQACLLPVTDHGTAYLVIRTMCSGVSTGMPT